MGAEFKSLIPLGITISGIPSIAKKYLKLSACEQKEKDSEVVLMDSKAYNLKILVSFTQEL